MDCFISHVSPKQIHNHRSPRLKSKKPHKRTTTKAAPFPLISLAPELQLIVAENLDPLDRISLKLTNRHFYQTIPDFKQRELPRAQDQLYKRRGPSNQAIPGTNIRSDECLYLACMRCWRLRPSTKFADEQQRYSPVLRVSRHLTRGISVKSYSTSHRSCISCGILDGKDGHRQGDIISVNEMEVVVCNFCSGYGWNGEEGTRRRAAGLCQGCWRVLEATRSSED